MAWSPIVMAWCMLVVQSQIDSGDILGKEMCCQALKS